MSYVVPRRRAMSYVVADCDRVRRGRWRDVVRTMWKRLRRQKGSWVWVFCAVQAQDWMMSFFVVGSLKLGCVNSQMYKIWTYYVIHGYDQDVFMLPRANVYRSCLACLSWEQLGLQETLRNCLCVVVSWFELLLRGPNYCCFYVCWGTFWTSPTTQ